MSSYVSIFPTGKGGQPCDIVSGICAGLATIAVAGRFWARWKHIRKIKTDDWLMLTALIFLLAYCSSVIVASVHITQTPTHDISLSDFEIAIDMLNSAEIFYLTTVMFLKLSVGLFFLGFLNSVPLRRLVYVIMGISTVFSIAMILFALFQCGLPTDAFHFVEKRLSTNDCVSDSAALGMTYTHAVITILSDWTFVCLPFFLLRDSLMNRKEKWTLTGILAFASLSGVAAIARLPYITLLAVPKYLIFKMIKNIAVFSAIEPAIGIIAASLVTMRPLFRVFFGSSRGRGGYRDLEVPDLPTISNDAGNDHVLETVYIKDQQRHPKPQYLTGKTATSIAMPDLAKQWEKVNVGAVPVPGILGVLLSPSNSGSDSLPRSPQPVQRKEPRAKMTFLFNSTMSGTSNDERSDLELPMQRPEQDEPSKQETHTAAHLRAERSSWLSKLDSPTTDSDSLAPQRSTSSASAWQRTRVFPLPRKSYREPGLPLHMFGAAEEEEDDDNEKESR